MFFLANENWLIIGVIIEV